MKKNNGDNISGRDQAWLQAGITGVTRGEIAMDNIQLQKKTVLITGSAGFIGAALARALLKKFFR